MLSSRLLLLACAFALLILPSTAAAASDPVGDNCKGTGLSTSCGPDLTGADSVVAADGTVTLTITRASSVCDSFSYPAVEVQPYFVITSNASGGVADEASYKGAVWAVSTTSNFVWSPQGGQQSDDVAIASTVTPGSVTVTIPASIIASVGGLPLKWYVNNSCKDFPFEPVTAYTDYAPDSGLYTLTAPAIDKCPNIAGDQASVPSGMFVDGAGSCVADVCPNIAGGQASIPGGMFADGTGQCVADVCPNVAGGQTSVPDGYTQDASGNCNAPVTSVVVNVPINVVVNVTTPPVVMEMPIIVTGTNAANTIIANALNNLIRGLGGNDKLYGRAGNDKILGGAGNDLLLGEVGNDKLQGDAGADTAKGGAGRDTLTGGAGRDKLQGDAGNDTLNGADRAGGDTLNGGAGFDVCTYNKGDVLVGCERKILK